MTKIYRPDNEDQISDLIQSAALSAERLEICGGGTRSALSQPIKADATLSTASCSGVKRYNPGALSLVVAAGTPVSEIEALLASEGQMLPFEPIDHRRLLESEGVPTIGAVVAGNLSGPRRIQVGACRDSLIGVRFVNGKGEIISNGGRVMKNVTGYDLVKLLCGSWGTLGVLTEVSFKILPKPEAALTISLSGLDMKAAVDTLTKGLSSPFEVTGAAHIPNDQSKTYLRIEGFADQVSYRADQISQLVGGDCERVEGDAHEAIWQGLRNVTPFAEDQRPIWRIHLAPSAVEALTRRISERFSSRFILDWGGGLIWAATDADAPFVFDAVSSAGGHATLIKGPATLRDEARQAKTKHPRIAAIETALRSTFDPQHILNPGRLAD